MCSSKHLSLFPELLESIRAKAAATPHGPNDPMDLGVFELPSEAQRLIHSIATENRTGQAPGPVFQGTGGYSLPLPRPLDKGVVERAGHKNTECEH